MKALEDRGVSMKRVTDQLLVDGLKQFSDAFVKLLATIGGPEAKSSGFAPFAFKRRRT
jgi:hypothetical protein